MNIKIKRDFVIPYLALIFLIVALSGILMFFHMLDDYTKVVHEFLGLAFACFALLHVVTNRNSIRNYFAQRKFTAPAVAVIILASGLIIGGKLHGNLEQELLNKLVRAPASDSFRILNIDYGQAREILTRNSISVRDSLESVEEIAIRNKKSPEEIIELIIR